MTFVTKLCIYTIGVCVYIYIHTHILIGPILVLNYLTVSLLA